MTLQELLTAIESRLKAATPGPYDARVREFSNRALCEVWTEFGWYQQLPRDYREPTTDLFANVPTDLAKLLAIVRRQSEALEMICGPGMDPAGVAYGAMATARECIADVEHIAGGE